MIRVDISGLLSWLADQVNVTDVITAYGLDVVLDDIGVSDLRDYLKKKGEWPEEKDDE